MDVLFLLLLISPLIALTICIGCTRHRTLLGLAAVPVGLWLVLAAWVAHEIAVRQANQTTNGEEGYGIMLLAMAGVPLAATSLVLLVGGLVRQRQARARMAIPADAVAEQPQARGDGE